MAYGILKVDTVTFTDGGVDKSVSISGLVQNPTFSGNITVTGTVSGDTIQGQTVSGATVTGATGLFSTGTFISLTGTTSQGTTATYTSGSFTFLTGVTTSGTTANFVSGVFSTQISGETVTGNTGAFTTLTGGVTTITSGVFAAGSAANPSISFTSDPDTGLYSPGADQLALSTSGTGKLFIDSAGKVTVKGAGTAAFVVEGTAPDNSLFIEGSTGHVGIGTNLPNSLTEIRGTNAGAEVETLRLTNDSTTAGTSSSIIFNLSTVSSTSAKIAAIRTNSPISSDTELAFSQSTNGVLTERLRITSAGRVGIGTASPSGLLHVANTGTAGTTADNLSVFFSSANRNATVNIIAKNTESSILNLGDGDSSSVGRIVYEHASNYMAFDVNASERLRITSAGLVGIGTSSPDGPLHVMRASAGTVTANGNADELVIENNSTGGISILTPDANHGYLIFGSPSDNEGAIIRYRQSDGIYSIGTEAAGGSIQLRSGNGTTALTIDSSQRVGIGTTSPGYALEVAANTGIIAFDADGINGNKIRYGGAGANANVLRFLEYAGTERARIDSSGRLLVGTTSARANFYNSTLSALFQQEGAASAGDPASRFMSLTYGKGNNDSGVFVFAKHRATTVGGQTIVADGDSLGEVNFQGSDGTEFVQAASIRAAVDGGISVTAGSFVVGRRYKIATIGTTDFTLIGASANTVGVIFQATGVGTGTGTATTEPYANSMPGRLVFSTTADGSSSPTEAMSITSEGYIFTDSTARTNSASVKVLTGGLKVISASTDATTRMECFANSTATRYGIAFSNPNGVVGSISTNASATAYNTSSDYRLKENIIPVTDGITRLQQLKPSRFNFIVEPDKTVDGFIAHEVQTIVPEAITGEKDAVDDDGNPIYQGIDQSKLVPLLTAALQEAVAKIESLEARLDAANL